MTTEWTEDMPPSGTTSAVAGCMTVGLAIVDDATPCGCESVEDATVYIKIEGDVTVNVFECGECDAG